MHYTKAAIEGAASSTGAHADMETLILACYRGLDQAPPHTSGSRERLVRPHSRLISTSGLKRCCSPSRTKPDLAKQKNQCD